MQISNKIFGGVNNKSVIIGAGTYGEVYLSYLQECGIEVVAFMDNNPALIGTYVKGIPVLGSETLLETDEWKQKVSNVYCPIGNNPLRRKILSKVNEFRIQYTLFHTPKCNYCR